MRQVLNLEEAEVKPVVELTLLYLPHCESEFTASIMRTFAVAPACIARTAVLGAYHVSVQFSKPQRWCGLR